MTDVNKYSGTDIYENKLRESMPDVLDILLIDRTKSNEEKISNIIWANDNYKKYGTLEYSATSEIIPELITGDNEGLIKPRALKSLEIKKQRTKNIAEVYTPTWVVKQQNDEIDDRYRDDDIETYVKRTWLEVTCGEAPYMATRYNMETGEIIPIENRVGFIDRKLNRLNKEINDKAEWQRLVLESYKASYGFEWNGDSLLLARENLLYTYRDYYVLKWSEEPILGLFKEVANIISYNVFQMDGLKFIIPFSEKREKTNYGQMSLFDTDEEEWIITPGIPALIMNWNLNKLVRFDEGES